MSATTNWVIDLAGTAADGSGDVTQLYPVTCTPGENPATAANGDLIRQPTSGALHSIQVKPDGQAGDSGSIEIYDINGLELGIDVSSGDTITDAQLQAAITAGTARLIYNQSFTGTVGSGVVNAPGIYRSFAKGLAARFVSDSDTGTCTLNLVVSGGFLKVESRGAT